MSTVNEMKEAIQKREEQQIVELAADLKEMGYTFNQAIPVLKETYPNMKTTPQALRTLRADIREELN